MSTMKTTELKINRKKLIESLKSKRITLKKESEYAESYRNCRKSLEEDGKNRDVRQLLIDALDNKHYSFKINDKNCRVLDDSMLEFNIRISVKTSSWHTFPKLPFGCTAKDHFRIMNTDYKKELATLGKTIALLEMSSDVNVPMSVVPDISKLL